MIYRCIDLDVDDNIYILTWLFFHSLRMVVLLMLNGRSGVSGKFLPMASSKCGDFTMSIVHVATGGFTWFLPGKRGIHSVQNGILDIISYEPAKLKMLRDNSFPEVSKFPNCCTGRFPLMDPAVTTMMGVCHEVYLLYPVVFEAVLWVRKSRAREASKSIGIYWLFFVGRGCCSMKYNDRTITSYP